VRCRWWEFDLNYAIIRALAWTGLATHVIPGRGSRETQRAAHVEDEAPQSAIPAPHITDSFEPAPTSRVPARTLAGTARTMHDGHAQ
jgi:hypothetical protein